MGDQIANILLSFDYQHNTHISVYLPLSIFQHLPLSTFQHIVPDAQFSLTVPDLITKQIMRNKSRHILSIVTRIRTGHGSSKEWFERFHIPQDSQKCECGELKTLRHILIECVWYDDLRQKLKRVPLALDLSC